MNNKKTAVSNIDTTNQRAVKTAFIYLLIAIFCALFGGVYECFSHGVYSFYMIYAFAFPLAGGTLLFLVIFLFKVKTYPCTVARNLYHSGVATVTVGSILKGVLDIYGTTNSLMVFYSIAGVALTMAGVVVYSVQRIRQRA